MILTSDFFNKPTLIVAQELLGKFLVRKYRSKIIRAMITEVEAYDGFKDKASHASHGLTKRNFPMFGPAGYWYVYFTYGMHWLLNIVTGKKGYPAAILIRGVIVEADKRGSKRGLTPINGPARVTKFFKIDKYFNNKKADRKTGLWLEDRGVRISKSQITKSARIGVSYAGPIWSKKKYRFLLETT